MPPLNSPDGRIKESKVSTLTNAAKISHLINETTIGPHSSGSLYRNKSEVVRSESTTNNVEKQPFDPWKRNVWREVDLESEKRQNGGSAFNLMDYKAIQLKMASKNAEKKRQKQVKLEMAQHQARFNEIDNMMKNLKIDLTEKSASRLQKNLLSKEEEVLQIVQQLENNARIADEQTNREIEEHNRKMVEKINRLRRVEEIRGYFQSIKSMKDLFIMLFEKFVKTCVSNQKNLKNFEHYTQAREGFLARYENVIKIVNSGHLSAVEVDTLEKLCDEIRDSQRSVDEEIKNAEELERMIADRNEKLRLEEEQRKKDNPQIENQHQLQQQQQQQEQQQQQQQQQHQQQQHTQQQSAPFDALDAPNILSAISTLNRFVSNERLNHYSTIMKLYEEYTQSVKALQNDENMRKFRFDCQKGVNTLLNTICAVSQSHLQEKFDKLALILSGNPVQIGGIQVNTSQHPLGIRFVSLLIAKKIVNQADTAISSSPRAAFPIASLMVAIWQKFPDVGKLFLAYFYKACPYLVPYFIPQVEGQSTQEYLKSVGFHFNDNKCEENDRFLKRLSGLVRLYSSVIISKSRRGINKPHPHGIENAWIWLTNILNLDPLPDVSATMIYEFLVTVGHELWRVYNKQFLKLLHILQTKYMLKLDEMDRGGGPKSRLEGLLNNIIKENKIDEPQDLLPANFW